MNIISRLFLIICIFTTYPAFSKLEIKKTIQVGGNPAKVKVTPNGQKLYVTDAGSNVVRVIDTATNTVIANIPASTPNNLDISPDGGEVYVSQRFLGSILVIDTVTDTASGAPINLGGGAIDGVTFNPSGNKVYVVSDNVNGTIPVNIIDVASRTVIDTFTTPTPQEEIVFSPDGSLAYLGRHDLINSALPISSNVIDVTSNAILDSIPDTWLRIVTQDGAYGWGVSPSLNEIHYVDLVANEIINTLSVKAIPTEGMVLSPDESTLYIANSTSNLITAIDTNTRAIVELPVGNFPTGAAITPDGKFLYVANNTDGTVSVIQTNAPDNGLVAHYTFDGNANDSTNNVNDGTEFGNVNYVEGVLGQAAQFSSDADYVLIPHQDNITFPLGTDYTTSVWFNSDFSDPADVANGQKIFFKGIAGIGANYALEMYTYNGTEYIYLNSDTRIKMDHPVNTWTHAVSLYRSSTDTFEMYINGQKIPLDRESTHNFETGSNPLTVGGKTPHTDSNSWNGKVDDLRIYNRALSEAEIQTLFSEVPNNTVLSIISPPSLDFGQVIINSYNELTFIVNNSGTGTLTGDVSTNNPFSIVSGNSFNLEAGISQPAVVRFNPTTIGNFIGNVNFNSNGGNISQIVTGSGMAAPKPEPKITVSPSTPLDFGNVAIDSPTDRYFLVQNTGNDTLNGTCSIDNNPAYSLPNGCIYSVPSGQSVSITVRFSSTQGVTYKSNVTFSSNGGIISRDLVGTGEWVAEGGNCYQLTFDLFHPKICNLLEKMRSVDYFNISYSNVSDEQLLPYVKQHKQEIKALLLKIEYGKRIVDFLNNETTTLHTDDELDFTKFLKKQDNLITLNGVLNDIVNVITLLDGVHLSTFRVIGSSLNVFGTISTGVKAYKAALKILNVNYTEFLLIDYFNKRCQPETPPACSSSPEFDNETAWLDLLEDENINFKSNLEAFTAIDEKKNKKKNKKKNTFDAAKLWLESSFLSYQLYGLSDSNKIREDLGKGIVNAALITN